MVVRPGDKTGGGFVGAKNLSPSVRKQPELKLDGICRLKVKLLICKCFMCRSGG